MNGENLFWLGALVLCALLLRWFSARARPRKRIAPRSAPAPAMPDNAVIVDGSNVMHWGGDASVDTLGRVIRSLEGQAFAPFVFFDANAGYKLRDRYVDDCEMASLLDLPPDRVIVVPKGVIADSYILALAGETGLPIVSNDRFRDWAGQYPWVRDHRRLMRGSYAEGTVRWVRTHRTERRRRRAR